MAAFNGIDADCAVYQSVIGNTCVERIRNSSVAQTDLILNLTITKVRCRRHVYERLDSSAAGSLNIGAHCDTDQQFKEVSALVLIGEAACIEIVNPNVFITETNVRSNLYCLSNGKRFFSTNAGNKGLTVGFCLVALRLDLVLL